MSEEKKINSGVTVEISSKAGVVDNGNFSKHGGYKGTANPVPPVKKPIKGE